MKNLKLILWALFFATANVSGNAEEKFNKNKISLLQFINDAMVYINSKRGTIKTTATFTNELTKAHDKLIALEYSKDINLKPSLDIFKQIQMALKFRDVTLEMNALALLKELVKKIPKNNWQNQCQPPLKKIKQEQVATPRTPTQKQKMNFKQSPLINITNVELKNITNVPVALKITSGATTNFLILEFSAFVNKARSTLDNIQEKSQKKLSMPNCLIDTMMFHQHLVCKILDKLHDTLVTHQTSTQKQKMNFEQSPLNYGTNAYAGLKTINDTKLNHPTINFAQFIIKARSTLDSIQEKSEENLSMPNYLADTMTFNQDLVCDMLDKIHDTLTLAENNQFLFRSVDSIVNNFTQNDLSTKSHNPLTVAENNQVLFPREDAMENNFTPNYPSTNYRPIIQIEKLFLPKQSSSKKSENE